MLVSEALSLLQNLTKKNISQAELARVLNMSPVAINKRIARRSEIKVSEVEVLEKHYNISIISNHSGDDSVELPYYSNVNASCGTGLMVFDESVEKIQIAKICIKDYSKHKQYSIINAHGNSMFPTLIEDDKLIIEHNVNDIIDGHIYVFRYEDGIFVKRLYKNVNQLVIKSDNKEFDEIKLDKSERTKVCIIGTVIGLIREF